MNSIMIGRSNMSRPLRAIAHVLPIVTLMISTFTAQAQEVREITFNEAIEIALERNVTIKRAENNLKLQEITVQSERADFLPNLNFNTGASRNFGLQFDQTTGSLVNASSDGFNYSASSGLNIFNGFADVASLEGARAVLESQEANFARTQQQVVFNVVSNYLNVILAEENIRIRQEDVESQQSLLEQIEEFVRVGQRAVSDLYQQQATAASSEALLLTAESNFESSKTRLIQVLQVDPLANYAFPAPAAEDVPTNLRAYDPNELVRASFERRPDLKAQEFLIRASESNIKAAKAGYLPTLGMSFGAGSSYTSNSPFDFSDQMTNNRSERVSLSLSVPLFNRLNVKRGIQSSKVQYSNALLDMENLQQSVAIEVRQAYLDYQTAVKRLEVTEKSLRAADQAFQVEQERYNVGASTLVELTQSNSRYIDAASQRAQAVFQFHFQHRLIEYYQGSLDPTQPLFN